MLREFVFSVFESEGIERTFGVMQAKLCFGFLFPSVGSPAAGGLQTGGFVEALQIFEPGWEDRNQSVRFEKHRSQNVNLRALGKTCVPVSLFLFLRFESVATTILRWFVEGLKD